MVIPARDEAAGIERCVASARADEVEILVVDGGSEDATRSLAQHSGATVIGSRPGRARQLERGRRAASGEVLLFLHADTRLPRGYADAVRAALGDPSVVGGAFALRFEERTLRLRFVEWGAGLRLRWFAFPYGDQALFARRSVLEEIGGIPDVPFMEDLDLVRSLKRRGRLARLALPAVTSARRYLERGVMTTMLRNWAAASAWALGIERSRLAAWYRR